MSSLFASAMFLIFRAFTSHSKVFPDVDAAMLPSWTVSVNGPA